MKYPKKNWITRILLSKIFKIIRIIRWRNKKIWYLIQKPDFLIFNLNYLKNRNRLRSEFTLDISRFGTLLPKPNCEPK